MSKIFGGIEGGATGSRMVLIDAQGRRLGFSEGPETNQWLLGLDETVRRLLGLIDGALQDAHLPPLTPISHLGMSLSGVDLEETQQQLISALRAARPDVADTVRICNDALGTYMTLTDDPAVVLIAGTGSICKYIRKDLSFVRVGGYSYLLGDSGGGYYIAHWVISKFIEIEDGMIPWEHNTDTVRKIIYDFFKIRNTLDILPHFYETFNKGHIASLCERLAVAARHGEHLCRDAFHDAGIQLGRHVRACMRHAVKELDPSIKEMLVICCGSIFNSWDLLQAGFREVFSESSSFFQWRGTLNLAWLQISAAYGAARLAARLDAGLTIPCPQQATSLLDRIVLDC
ncbi:N-acetyl-D-glucosamine kinase [Paragonimus heterotremus]|uniref:N-acetyl-D-glucosamine kinase n=1 Tax=Paragonimus heterotremus TaxID=100268 RepID=A0A8J4SSG5_9TREM|nr:N-acetyl-D-glucosamine kinase [Paragonimus heterotremus]